MRRTLKSGLLAMAMGVAAGLALLLGAQGLLAADGEEGVVRGTVKINPLVVSLTVPGEPVSVGERFTVQARVENRGESRIQRVTATLQLPSGLEMRGPATRPLGTLQPLRSRSREWRLEAAQTGSFVLMVTADGIVASDGATVSAESGARIVTVE